MGAAPRCLFRKGAAGRGRPLLFVHGAFVGAWCWEAHFLDFFAALGHDCHALNLRGHGEGEAGGDLASLDDYVVDVLLAAEALPVPPVLIGHSMGAAVVQRAWRRARAPALALLAPVPPQGLLASSAMLALNSPVLFNEINRMQIGMSMQGEPALLRQAIFSPSLPEAEVMRHLARMRRESTRALMDLSWPQFFWVDRVRQAEVPLLVLGAADDQLFPPAMVEASAALHNVNAEIVPGVAHAMMLDTGWRDVAERIAGWLHSCDR
jgi:pimeloyl-ACP methyl ester carboxylesterase